MLANVTTFKFITVQVACTLNYKLDRSIMTAHLAPVPTQVNFIYIQLAGLCLALKC
ncbi:hypothetical protein Plhal304r1_c073g0161321 [Plasmopara halstedii]